MRPKMKLLHHFYKFLYCFEEENRDHSIAAHYYGITHAILSCRDRRQKALMLLFFLKR